MAGKKLRKAQDELSLQAHGVPADQHCIARSVECVSVPEMAFFGGLGETRHRRFVAAGYDVCCPRARGGSTARYRSEPKSGVGIREDCVRNRRKTEAGSGGEVDGGRYPEFGNLMGPASNIPLESLRQSGR